MIRKNINFIFRLISLTCILLAMYQFQIKATTYQEKVDEVKKEQIRLAKEAAEKFKNGKFTGEAYGFAGYVSVQVIIKDGGIDKINLIAADNEDQPYLDMSMIVLDKIIEVQGPEVDTVSGATFTSQGLIDASREALLKAVKE